MQQLELHRRANTTLHLLPPKEANNVRKTFSSIEEYADNLFELHGVQKFTGKALPNTYMIEATPSLRIIFQIVDDDHILVQDIVHRDLFTLFKQDDK